MQQPTFSIGKSISEAWQIFKEKWQVILGLAIAGFLIQYVPAQIVGPYDGSTQSAFYFVMQLVMMVLNFLVAMVWIHAYIKLSRREEITIESIKSILPLAPKYLAGVLLTGLIVVVGLILFIIPGLYFALKYAYVPYLIIDKEMGPLEAMRASAKITDGVKGNLFVLMLALVGINILGLLALVVGIVVTSAVSAIASALVYTQLAKRLKSDAV